MKAILMSAGEGTRLRPLTYGIPKQLLPVAGRPVIDYVIDNILKSKEIDEIIITVSHLAHLENSLRNYISNTRSSNNIKIVNVLGWETGGDLKLLAKQLDLKEKFLVAYGDVVTDLDVNKLIKSHNKEEALVTLALFEVPHKDIDKFGVVKLEGDVITQFIEKPKPEEAPSNLANAGYYIVEPEVLEYVPFGKVKMEHSAFPKLAEMRKLKGIRFTPSMWVDIGTLPSYIKANKLAEILLPPEQTNTK